VRRVVLAQATILGVCGAVVGCVLGLILTEVMILVSSSPGFQLGYSIPWQSIILAIVVSAAGSLLAVVIPARRGATASIIASVRYE
jgi:putative ABC transport system permease protein